MKVAYVGHFHGTRSPKVSQIRYTKYSSTSELTAIKTARIASKSGRKIRDLISNLVEAAQKDCLQ